MQDSDQRRIVGILFSNLQLTVKIGEGEFGMSTGRNLQLLHTLSVANHNDYYYEKTGNNQVTLGWSVKPCEAKTESDGKPILVKIYKARDPLGILDTKRDPNIAAFLGYSNAQDNVLFQVFHNPGSEPCLLIARRLSYGPVSSCSVPTHSSKQSEGTFKPPEWE
ncbi:hypothetical protein BU17DRAFT_72388 [Hysterangium stoloniferum]|nr:hypothetical protein BU17DRAFT_72388 [Hysterangium stoloniferum]